MNKYPQEVVVQSGIIKEIVCEENRSSFRLKNKSDFFIQKIKVDNGVVKTGIRCDYAIDVNDRDCEKNNKNEELSKKIYLIELKGSDKDHACEQIIQSYIFFQLNYKTKSYHCRIVLSKDHAPKLLTPNQKRLIKLEKQKKLDVLIKSQIIEEVM